MIAPPASQVPILELYFINAEISLQYSYDEPSKDVANKGYTKDTANFFNLD